MANLLAVNKPSGLTSHDCVEKIRRLTGLKAGHTSTLDPQATGLLLVMLDQATKLAPLFAGLPKKYRATFRFGVKTDTDDIWGKTIAEAEVPDYSQTDLETALAGFAGIQKQRVPAFSAVKQEGKPLYKRARRGEEVETPAREVTFYSIKFLKWSPPELTLDVFCSAGTYIRALARDLGEKLGCGAAMSALTRTAVGSASLENSVDLNSLTFENWRKFALAPEKVAALPILRLLAEEGRVRNGLPLYLSDLDGADEFQKGQAVLVKNDNEKLIAWGHLAESAAVLRENPRQPAFVYGRVLV
jgi:tRNA pseudouridine55 synthase